ncbi:hypothetical protein H6CHR_04007 [Variovorax sp. PBL-H6]|uniref:YeiH family protein n=1 Tax=Variovorax sp. PBL-H6 TaxID=434009 RepID=UPI00131682F8|nr:putative sulfate exporter family transporter [Variovorax sp. PBL-H6]VTU33470.1 hypothetical protein H6CHR_04007 [Variovorax sp. PBL-H6]
MHALLLRAGRHPWCECFLRLWPGSALALVVMLAATFISEHYGGPQLLYALFFGLAFHFLYDNARCRPGIDWCTRFVLRAGVALLGASMTAGQIGALGIGPLAVATGGVASTVLLGAWLARRFGAGTDFGLLCASAVSICGASAALAVSAVMPKGPGSERQTLLAVVGVTSLSTLAMILYPGIARLLGLSDVAAGIFLGGTIHDVAQVVGAGLMISHTAADTAVLVKLFRVALLVPLVAGLAWYWRRRAHRAGETGALPGARSALVPAFLLAFIALVLVNSAGLLPSALGEVMSLASRFCLVLAIAALGIKTSFEELVKLGWHPLALLLIDTLWLALIFLGYLLLRH